MPYDRYGIKTVRNTLLWSPTTVESIKRPVCFIPTMDSITEYRKWSSDISSKIYRTADFNFNLFEFAYCDRSGWNSGSNEERRIQSLTPDICTTIRDIATSGINCEDVGVGDDELKEDDDNDEISDDEYDEDCEF